MAGVNHSVDGEAWKTLLLLQSKFPGEYSSPPSRYRRGKYGLSLIYLKTKVAAHKANLTEDYDMIKNAALEDKKGKVIDKWIMNKVQTTSIKINEQYRGCPFVEYWKIP